MIVYLYCFIFFIILLVFFLMVRRPPRSTRTDTLFPYTTLFRSRWPSKVVWPSTLPCSTPASSRLLSSAAENCCLPTNANWPISGCRFRARCTRRSEEHTSELQSLMRISYAVFCLTKQQKTQTTKQTVSESLQTIEYTPA